MPVNNTTDITQDQTQDEFFTPDKENVERRLLDSHNSSDDSTIIREPEMNKYKEFTEWLQILQTIICYFNPRNYAVKYLKLIIGYTELDNLVSVSVLRCKSIYHDI